MYFKQSGLHEQIFISLKNALLQQVLLICIVQIQLELTLSYNTQSVSMTLVYP